MQIKQFAISGLFGAFQRVIPFHTHPEEAQELSLVLLHGPNGSGKTTCLNMIDGMMALDFSIFREIPFDTATLGFSTGDTLSVSQSRANQPLHVRFRDNHAVLHPRRSGPNTPSDKRIVQEFQEEFFSATQTIRFELLHTWRRTSPATHEQDDIEWDVSFPAPYRSRHGPLRTNPMRGPRSRSRKQSLADRVARFIADAQVNYRRFFRSSEPDFLSGIITRLQADTPSDATAPELLDRLTAVKRQADDYERLGVQADTWDFEIARRYLLELIEPANREGLSVMTAATEVLEARAREQTLLAERLLIFEDILNEYFRDKTIMVDPRLGLTIKGISGDRLTEQNLSSGEHHLLYLMVAALETQRRGTVLAIDEPELSMHISWQRKLIDSLRKCASNASPQMLLATHSPDIVGGYRDYLVEFGNVDELLR